MELERFVRAQDAGGTYQRALAELRAGRKVSHWMWFVFPQLAGLGRSPTSRQYAIASLVEARAYLEHRVLGARLRECARALEQLSGRGAEEIFGAVDALKLRSSLTLFMRARPTETLFAELLERYFDGHGPIRPHRGAAPAPDRSTMCASAQVSAPVGFLPEPSFNLGDAPRGAHLPYPAVARGPRRLELARPRRGLGR